DGIALDDGEDERGGGGGVGAGRDLALRGELVEQRAEPVHQLAVGGAGNFGDLGVAGGFGPDLEDDRAQLGQQAGPELGDQGGEHLGYAGGVAGGAVQGGQRVSQGLGGDRPDQPGFAGEVPVDRAC